MPAPQQHVVASDVWSCVPVIDRAIESFLETSGVPDRLAEVLRYAVLGGGKRVRPVLAWWSSVAVGGAGDAALPAGVAVELVHAFSLVHDDLPAMDDDDERRGRPTVHVRFGESLAVLGGDALAALATRAICDLTPDPVLVAHLTRELALATCDMITGQVFDLHGVVGETDPRRCLETLCRYKTGALIRGACRMGARCGMAGTNDEKRLDAITRCGESLGLMFQIVDDLLDAGEERDGDEQQQLTFPRVVGAAASREEVERQRRFALDSLEPLGPAADPLRALADALAARTH